MISGMTGFGRAEGRAGWGSWSWEARSVNGKAIDARFSGPPGSEALEFETKRRLKERFARGSFQIQLRIEFSAETFAQGVSSREMSKLVRVARGWKSAGISPSTYEGLAQLVGGGRQSRSAPRLDESQSEEVAASLTIALDQLAAARAAEGRDLYAVFTSMLADMQGLVEKASSAAATQPQLVRERLQQRISELSPGAAIDAERLAQEVLLAANRADIREELDRLRAHIETARGLLAETQPAGRKLDFLSQEFNREANTMGSKSASLDLTNTAMSLKSLIDQFREQAQNVE
jgi:uncharacterized protein (TIGR00255 family)